MKDILEELPDAYDPETWERKSDAVFNHIFASYYDDGQSVYDDGAPSLAGTALAVAPPPTITPTPAAIDIAEITQDVLDRIKTDPSFAEQVAEQLRGKGAFFAVPSIELIAGGETHEVEFKSTARWNLQEGRKDKRMEDAVVKTVAGFLNTDGGTLLIGINDRREPVGLGYDTATVKPPNADGFVNWLTIHLIHALSSTVVMRTRTRIDEVDGVEICRVDVAPSSAPVRAWISEKREVFWVRMNNSTRELLGIDIEDYIRDRW